MQNEVELVVLATGMKPATNNLPIDKSIIDGNGFINLNGNGITNKQAACGVVTEPKDVASTVREATGSVLRAIQTIKRN